MEAAAIVFVGCGLMVVLDMCTDAIIIQLRRITDALEKISSTKNHVAK